MPLWVEGLVVWARALNSVQAALPAAHEVVTLSDAAIGLSSIVMVYLLKVVVRTEKNVASMMQRMDGTKDEPGIASNVRKLLEGQESHSRSLGRVEDNYKLVNGMVTAQGATLEVVLQDVERNSHKIADCPVHVKGQTTHE